MRDSVRQSEILVRVSEAGYAIRSQVLLQDISFNIHAGEKLIVLGASGSGKSLLVDALVGNIGHTGEISWPEDFRKRDLTVSYDTFGTFSLLKVKEFLSFLAAMYSLPMDDELVSALGVDEILSKQIRVLSKGERKRVGVLAALFPSPKLAILDEPTDGMDPILRAKFWKIVHARSHAVVLTTHLWDEAQTHHDRIAMMADGRLLHAPSPADELLKLTPFIGKIVFVSAPAGLALTGPHLREGEVLTAYFGSEDERTRLLAWAKGQGILLAGYSILPIDLLDVYQWMKGRQND